jgi:iduronate 2-sulfatase
MAVGQAAPASMPSNVLLIYADDLRGDLSGFGSIPAQTPNLDRLAARGRVFRRAYVQQALCNPSRASMLTGLRPDRTGVYDLVAHFRDRHPSIITLPQRFKQAGYEVVGIGKIFHNLRTRIEGDPESWSRPQIMHWGNHRDDQALGAGQTPRSPRQVGPHEALDVPDEAYWDGKIASAAVARLSELKDRPFFLAVGFWKPHLPFNAPKRYWDLYDRQSVAAAFPAVPPAPAPAPAGHDSWELRGYAGVAPAGAFPPDSIATLRHGYLAGISYLDAQVGRVLAELERLDLVRRTVVVFVSDNGFHLGERGLVGKLTNYELDTRVPLIVAAPGIKDAGMPTDALVELVDVYPTLIDLCGLSAPHALDGLSLRPLLIDPLAQLKSAALSQHPRPANLKGIETMGYAVRTSDHRYVEWRRVPSGEVVSRELYALANDPAETVNLAADATATEQVSRHARLLAALLAGSAR